MRPPRRLCQEPASNGNASEVRDHAVPPAAKSQDHLANLRLVTCDDGRRHAQLFGKAQHCDIGGRVTASKLRLDGFARRGIYGDFVIGLQGIAGGDNDARLPDEATCD